MKREGPLGWALPLTGRLGNRSSEISPANSRLSNYKSSRPNNIRPTSYTVLPCSKSRVAQVGFRIWGAHTWLPTPPDIAPIFLLMLEPRRKPR